MSKISIFKVFIFHRLLTKDELKEQPYDSFGYLTPNTITSLIFKYLQSIYGVNIKSRYELSVSTIYFMKYILARYEKLSTFGNCICSNFDYSYYQFLSLPHTYRNP